MELRRWLDLYARAERAARAYFGEHFGDVCAQCYHASCLSSPDANCCRRTNFLPDIISDPLLGALAEESLGGSLLALSGPHNAPGCAALGETGCRIPFGRPDACNSYVCEHLHRCAMAALSPPALSRLQDAMDVFQAIHEAPRRSDAVFEACTTQVALLERRLEEASQQIRRHANAFAARKSEVIFDLFPPVGSRSDWR